MLTFGSLFAGIGGIDLGLERCGMQCKWQVELDDYARRVLAKHWPDVRRHDDIRTWPTEDAERVDLIAGGFPCQDISFAGKGAGIHGKQSGLFFELARVVREMEPRYVLMENVSAILAPGRGMGDVLGTLATLGYDAWWHCIPAAYVGAPHIRDRVFIVGYASSERWNASWNDHGQNDGPVPNATGKYSSLLANATGLRWNVSPSEESGSYPVATRQKREIQTEPIRRCGINDFESGTNGSWQQWASEPDVGRVAHGIPSRVDRLRGLGNAVVPQVAEYVGRMILKHEEQSCNTRSE